MPARTPLTTRIAVAATCGLSAALGLVTARPAAAGRGLPRTNARQ